MRITKSRQTNTQALCVLDSYLTACKVPHEVLDGKKGIDLRIEKADGGHSNVTVQVDLLAQAPKDTDIIVLVEDVMSLNRDEVLAAFHSITEPLGWGKPVPVDRGVAPEGKVRDVHLLIIRHREWRNAPNLSEQVLKDTYDNTIRFFARLVLRDPASREVVVNAGEDFDSLCLIGRIIAMNFHHKYRDVRKPADTNRTYFAAHLKQRFQNAVSQWRKQQASMVPDDQTVAITLTGDVNSNPESYDPTVAPAEDESYLLDLSAKEVRALSPRLKAVRNRLVEQRNGRAEARAALGNLDQRLGQDHVERMRMLTEAASRDPRHIDPEARTLAQKKLAIEITRCALVESPGLATICPYSCHSVANDMTDIEEDSDSLA